MDKRAIIGIFLIVIITFLMPYYFKWMTGEDLQPSIADSLTHVQSERDSIAQTPSINEASPEPVVSVPETLNEAAQLSQAESLPASAPNSFIVPDSAIVETTIETPLLSIQVTNEQGAKFTHWILKKYDYFEGGQVDLARPIPAFAGEYHGLDFEIVTNTGQKFDLSDYQLHPSPNNSTSIYLDGANPVGELEYFLPVAGGKIIKTYRFYFNQYSYDVFLTFENLQNFMGKRAYSAIWKGGLAHTEENVKEDYSYARAYAYQNGELVTHSVSADEVEKIYPQGKKTDWTAIRTKYFVQATIPHSPDNINVEIIGRGKEINDIEYLTYTTELEIPIPPQSINKYTDSLTVFLGPLDYKILKAVGDGLDNLVMNKDWYEGFFLFRFINIYFVLPAFDLLHKFIPNYGLIIIIFSIFIKLILHPLTKKSYQSMSEMQYVQPLMAEMREKYKNDAQRLNKEMMKLYKERGINPLGGCIPTILQMPLLFALFVVFRSTIQLRGEPFILWITDLSRPDHLALGTSLPFIGDTISVLPILMAATMIWQSKMTMTDPKQKAMIYIMPVFLLFIFYSLPSGLNLYYSVFNLLSMVQTRMIKKRMHPDNASNAQKPEPVITTQKKGQQPRATKKRSKK